MAYYMDGNYIYVWTSWGLHLYPVYEREAITTTRNYGYQRV